MAQALSRLMWRRGRRPGLQLGYLLAATGGMIAAVGAERWLAVFIGGLFLYGSGQASNLLARYAATDLADPDHRGRAMSHVVFASTFGAVFGPLLINPTERAGEEWVRSRSLHRTVVVQRHVLTRCSSTRPCACVLTPSSSPEERAQEQERDIEPADRRLPGDRRGAAGGWH